MALTTELWPHQADALLALRQTVAQGVRRICVQSPTGSGKTKLAAAIVDGARSKGNRIAFVVPAIDLIDQTVESFYAEGLTDVGVIQADHQMTDWSKPIQVCSIQTIGRRGRPQAQIVVVDECHKLFQAQKDWITDPLCEKVVFIGLSATPWTKGLGKFYDTLIVAETTQGLIEKGFLSKFRAFATGHPDLTGVKTVAGDYHEGQLSEAMQQGTLVADIIDTYKTRWGKGKTLVFGVDCTHAKCLQERFNQAGIPAGYQDAFTSMDERREIKRKFHSGDFQVVCNVGTLTTGVDWDVRCLVLARPTKSEMLYVQIIGRALRTNPEKEYALILDHSDTTSRLGLVTDIHHDQLDDGLPKQKVEKQKPLPKECKECGYLKPAGVGLCPNCGHQPKPPKNGRFEDEGELVEIDPAKAKRAVAKANGVADWTMGQKQTFFSELITFAEERGFKPGWAARKYKDRMGVWPNQLIKEPAAYVSGPTRKWLNEEYRRWKAQRDASFGAHLV